MPRFFSIRRAESNRSEFAVSSGPTFMSTDRTEIISPNASLDDEKKLFVSVAAAILSTPRLKGDYLINALQNGKELIWTEEETEEN